MHVICSSTLFLSLLAGCDRPVVVRLLSATTTEPTTGNSVAVTTPVREDPTSRLYVAGIDSPDDVRQFLARLQAAATAPRSRRVALVEFVRFPFSTYSNGKVRHTYSGPADLLDDVEHVFTPGVLRAIGDARYETMFVNYQGVMIGNGEVWFDRREDGIKIKAINR